MRSKIASIYKKHTAAALFVSFYLAALLLAVGIGLVNFAGNRMAYQSGELQTRQVYIGDFFLMGLVPTGPDTMYSFGDDPQMILYDAGFLVENVQMDISYSHDPVRIEVYWAEEGQPHSAENAAKGTADTEMYYLPSGGGYNLRIDPAAITDNSMQVNNITLNTPRPFWMFFSPTARQLALLAVVPGLLACAAYTLIKSALWLKLFYKNGGRLSDVGTAVHSTADSADTKGGTAATEDAEKSRPVATQKQCAPTGEDTAQGGRVPSQNKEGTP